VARYTIYLDDETEVLVQHLRMTDEKMSSYVQRMIREVGKAHGLEVETIIRIVQK
jgi:hypothetical protein